MKLQKVFKQFLFSVLMFVILLASGAIGVMHVQAQAVYELFAGTVTDQQGMPVTGAMVTANGVQVLTDETGYFQVYAARANQYVVNVKKSGYALFSSIENNPYGNAHLEIVIKQGDVFPINPEVGATITDSHGTQITLPANSLVDANGQAPVVKSINLIIHTYDQANEPIPGDNTANNGYLTSIGAFWVEFVDTAGNQYNLGKGQQATISIPTQFVAPSNQQPAIILPAISYLLWYYDETSGTWLEDGSTTLIAGRLQGQVSHFTAWDFGWAENDPACIAFTVDQSFFEKYQNTDGILKIKVLVLVNGNSRAIDVDMGNLFNTVYNGPHVIYNLPPNTTVNIYTPPFPPGAFYTSTSSGAPWDRTGVLGNRPPTPYTRCNGRLNLSYPPQLIITPTITQTTTLTVTPTLTATGSVTSTLTPTGSITPTLTATGSITPTLTPTSSITPTLTPTSSITPTLTPTSSITPTLTATGSITPTLTATGSITPTLTATGSITPTLTPTGSITPTLTPTPTIVTSWVGVIPDTQDCGTYDKITINMDTEDRRNASAQSGWVGAISTNPNSSTETRLVFCKVPGNSFKPLVSNSNQPGAHYAVLQLSESCPAGTVWFSRRFDNEDRLFSQNNSWYTPNGYNISPNWLSRRSPSATKLFFCLFRGGQTRMSNFTDLGFNYGVLAANGFIKALTTGYIHTDDEDTNNHNSYETNGSEVDVHRIVYEDRNTTILLAQVVNVQYRLTVKKTGPGVVTSNPVGIQCGATCAKTYPRNTVVTLKAVADAGYVFSGWGGACSGMGPCQVTMNQAQNVTATFEVRKAMTWAKNLNLSLGTTISEVECGSCDMVIGDTPVSAILPILCIYKQGLPSPDDLNIDFSHGWSGGRLKLTAPVRGDSLTGLAQANLKCRQAFGINYRMAEFHDGIFNGAPGGWGYYGYGNISSTTRFWVYINDQNANPFLGH